MPDEPIEQGGTGVETTTPAESGPDYSEWFANAGYDTKALPEASAVKAAHDFYSKYAGETELFTAKDLDQKRDEKITEYFRDPKVYNQLKEFFLKENGATSPAAVTQAETVDGVAVDPRVLEGIKNMGSRMDAFEGAVAELVQAREGYDKKQQLDDWHGNFGLKLRDAIQRADHKGEDTSKLEQSLRRRFTSGEIQNDSPQAIERAVKDLITEKRNDKVALLRELNAAGLINKGNVSTLDPKMSLEDVFADQDKREQLLSSIINRGMPQD